MDSKLYIDRSENEIKLSEIIFAISEKPESYNYYIPKSKRHGFCYWSSKRKIMHTLF